MAKTAAVNNKRQYIAMEKSYYRYVLGRRTNITSWKSQITQTARTMDIKETYEELAMVYMPRIKKAFSAPEGNRYL